MTNTQQKNRLAAGFFRSGPDLICYLFLNTGFLFSKNAATPSFLSSVSNSAEFTSFS